jgi:hypothetical protein
MKFKSILTYVTACGLLALGLYTGCKPENITTGNGLSTTNLSAAFTVTPITGKTNTYLLKADESNALGFRWDKGDGTASPGKAIDTLVLPDAGKYTIRLVAIGKGGATTTSQQDVTIATSDPVAGNLVVGGKFQTGDDAKWIHFIVGGGNNMVINTTQGVMTSNQTGYQAGGIAQTVNLVAGRKYKVDMNVSGSGMTNSWFEVWVDTKAPVNGQDYNTGTKPISLNTFAGCGSSAFSGLLSSLSCAGDGNPFTVKATGTYYLVIKNGGDNTGVTGISFTNVSLRGSN